MLKTIKYNPTTGVFTRYFTYIKKTKIIGSKDSSGYLFISIDGKTFGLHRLAFYYINGTLPKNEVDHINRIRDDNRWCNLREVTKTINQRNRTINKNNSSGTKGVYWNKNMSKWHSQIRYDGKRIHLGFFVYLEDAIKARLQAEEKYSYL